MKGEPMRGQKLTNIAAGISKYLLSVMNSSGSR